MVVNHYLKYLCQLSIGTKIQLTLFLFVTLMLNILADLSRGRLIATISQATHHLTNLSDVINLNVPPILNLLEKGLILVVLFLKVAQHGQSGRVVGFYTVTDEM